MGFLSSILISATSTDGKNRIIFDDLSGYINGANEFNCASGKVSNINLLSYFVLIKTIHVSNDSLIHSHSLKMNLI